MTHPSNGKQNPDHGLRLPAMSPLSVRVNIQIVIALLSDLQNTFWLFGYLWPQLGKEMCIKKRYTRKIYVARQFHSSYTLLAHICQQHRRTLKQVFQAGPK